MSAPPGYNAGDSLLQPQVQAHGGTASIVPVMGGGRVRGALKQIRRKHTKRGLSKKKGKTKTKKNKKGGLSQRGGLVNHYSLPTTDLTDNNEVSAQITTLFIPTSSDKDILEGSMDHTNVDNLIYYLKYQNKLWIRKLRETLFKNATLKSIVPTLENIGCIINRSSGGIYTKRFLQMYSPDRLCCILPKETGSITVLPAVNGKISTLKLVLTAIKTSMVNNNVFIFSPPFFGEILKDNNEVFYAFLKYKVEGLESKKYLFYILTDYSLMNIEIAKSVSENIYNQLKYYKLELEGGDQRLVGEKIKRALYPMLEPTYIIYPYAVSFPVTTLSSVVQNITNEQDRKIFQDAEKEYKELQQETHRIQKKIKETEKSLTKNRSEAFNLRNLYDTKVTEVERSVIQDTRFRFAYSQREIEQAVSDAVNKIDRKQLDSITGKIVEEEKAIEKLRADLEQKAPILKNKTQIYEEVKKRFQPQKGVTNTPSEIEEQRGGILFSAANKDESILPAPYSGFDGPIQYIQTNDANTARGSIAYRPDLTKKEPLLDTMNYKEYNLLLRPPMNSNSMYEFYLKNKSFEQSSTDSNPKMFLPNTKSSHMRVPGTAISVGLKEFVVRNPVPDVVADWESGIYSQDESDYLNAMKLTPEILRTVFQDNWKKELSNHLSMISRSKCFKDTRLILHSECQDAQKFISTIMKYYTENSKDILKLQREQDTDYMKRLQATLDSKMDEQNKRIEDSIFVHREFVRAFFAPKTDAGVKKDGFLLSVSPIIVSRKGTKFEVSYDEAEAEEDIRATRDKLRDYNLNINNKTWEFNKPINMYKLTRTARLKIPSFRITSIITNTDQPTSNMVYVSYFGILSPDDKELINKTTGSAIKSTESIKTMGETKDGLYELTFDKPVNLVHYQNMLNTIANNNIYHFTLTKRDDFSYEEIDYITPKTDLTGRSLITILMREKLKPDTDIAADFGMIPLSGLTAKQGAITLFQEFDRIANTVNSGSVFGGKYVISTGNRA